MIDTQAIRSKILDLAMRGKLTEQLPDDGTGKELLAKISTSKNGKLRGNKNGMPISFTPPFHLPRGWAWGQLETLGADVPCAFADGPFGSNLKKEHYTTERQVRIIQLSNVGVDGWRNNNEKYTTYDHLETIKRSEVKAGNIVIAKMMPAGRAIVVPEGIADAFVLSSDCVKFVPDPKLDVNFICYAINSNWFHDQVMKDVHGIGRERTSLSNLKRYFIPIPSEPEQHRIVARIEQAFSALDTIDTLQAKYADNLSVLKSKLIDAAIQGKLTEQQPEDGTAEDLYRQIQAEKARIIKERNGRVDKAIKVVGEDVPYLIPAHWKWIRFGDVGLFKKGPFGSALTKSMFVPKSANAIKVYEQQHAIKKNPALGTYYISEDYFQDRMKGFEVQSGDILISCAGTIGETYVMPDSIESGIINQALMRVTLASGINKQFFQYYFDSRLKSSAKEGNGSAIVNIPPFDVIKNWYFPLPPLAEQKRIVERVSELFAVCDELK